MRTKLRELKTELRLRMRQSIPVQGKWLAQVVSGLLQLPCSADQHSGNVGIPPSCRQPVAAYAHATQHKDATTFERMKRLVDGWLPAPCILHP
jgi:RNA-directed DNA polymerase